MKPKGNFPAEVAGSLFGPPEVIVVGDSDDSEYIVISDSSSDESASEEGEVSDMDQCSLDEGISTPGKFVSSFLVSLI